MAWTCLFVLLITLGLLGMALGLGTILGGSERVQFDRVLESRVIDGLQEDPTIYLGEIIAVQGPVLTIARDLDFGGAPADLLVVGGLEEGQTPLRIFVMGGSRGVTPTSVIRATGTGTEDPIDPTRLALMATEVKVLPIATFDVNGAVGSVLAVAGFFGALMAVLGVAWEREAAALSRELRDEESTHPSPRTPPFLTALTRGKDSLSVSLRMAFLGATGRALFVFGLIAFLYVYITVYVVSAASVDWWVHHWVPWLRLDVFAALGLIAAFVGLFLFTFVQELTKRR
ncbi:MAG: hypothetical protein LN413_02595 [Candidatus Thermoplasmatota archaeon]|nr:hypothetical protein [Candidatus Thermoplasmatota archaeon]